ncbi:helix-turn-helix domain-containing protein [Streptomyces chartreusis]
MAARAPVNEWLTARQVAAHFQVSERTVYRWVGIDPAMRVQRLGPDGRTVRIHRSILDRDQAAPEIPANT